MSVAIIAHVEEDRAYVDALTDALDKTRFIVCAIDPSGPRLAFDARLPLVLIWSRQAARARAGRAYAALVRSHDGEAILCAADRQPLPRPFAQLHCALVDGAPNSAFFPGGLGAAIAAASQRALRREREAASPPNFSGRAFAGGLARGLAGGAAVFGVGGVATLAVDAIGAPPPHEIVADSTFSVMDVAVAEREAADAFENPLIQEDAPPEELVQLAAEALNQADVPLASRDRAEQVARKVAALYADRPMPPLMVWAPDPAVAAPLEAVAGDQGFEFDDEFLEDGAIDDATIGEPFPSTDVLDPSLPIGRTVV